VTVTATHPYVTSLLEAGDALPQSPVAWLNARRAAALERANALTVPTTREEEWRFTDLTPLTRLQFQPAGAAADVAATDIAAFGVGEAAARLTFVDGVYVPTLSPAAALPEGIAVLPLADALKTHAAVIEAHLAQLAGIEHDPFAALNTAFLQHGVFIHAAKNAVGSQPIHLLFVATRKVWLPTRAA